MEAIFKQPGSWCETYSQCPAGKICRRGLSTLMAPDDRFYGAFWRPDHTGKCQHWIAIDAAWAKKNQYPVAKLEAEFNQSRGINEKPTAAS